MLQKTGKFIFIFLFLLLGQKLANASHISGGEVTYTSLGNNQYKVILTIYWDCGQYDPGTTESITADNTCGLASVTFTVNRDTTYEVSQICPNSIGQTTCNGGTLPGNSKNIYSAIVTLPGACSQWTFELNGCCRNISTNVVNADFDDYDFYATLNNADAPNNNSPYFTSQPLPYMCVGQPVCYNPGVVETDGNTLAYSFVSAMEANSTTPVAYSTGYSGTTPMTGITIDQNTGLISFTPTAIGNYVVCFLVEEKNANGVIIGSIIRDIQMVVVSCTNQVIPCNAGGIDHLTGTGATATSPNSMQICENIPFTFDMTFTDPDGADVLTYTSNIQQVLPGAIINSSGTNPITVNVSWTAPAGSANTNTNFALTIKDNACPVTGQQTVNYDINVLPAANAGADQTICGSQTATLNATGPGSSYTWSVINGPPIIVGTNFSCNPCQNPIASPTATTKYLLTCNGSSGCIVTDTVMVFVTPNFTYNITQSSVSSCLLTPVNIGVANISPAGSYTYQWNPVTNLSNTASPNTSATFNAPGTHTYTVTISSAQGCVQSSPVSITATASYSPQITASNDTTFNVGGIVNLNTYFSGPTIPATCGLSLSGGCGGTSTASTIGTDTTSNSATNYPAPYGNYYTSSMQQYLYTAAELNAAGISGGKIDQLDFYVKKIKGITTYHEYTIKMGCTNLTTFNATTPVFETGLLTVYPAQTKNIVTGWNTHIFSNAFEWDGLSNIIIQICFSELPPTFNYTNNCSTTNTTTAYVSSIWSNDDSDDQCTTITGSIGSANKHPNIILHHCSIIANPASFSYQWTPSIGNIANPSAQNTVAQPPCGITDFIITVTNPNGGCSDKDTVRVNVLGTSTIPATIAYVAPICIPNAAITLQSAVPGGIWSGAGITDSILGKFDPNLAGIGNHLITYNVLCAGMDTTIISVSQSLDASISPITASQKICKSDSPVTLIALNGGGIWSGAGVTNNTSTTSTFDPVLAGVGSYYIKYTIPGLCGDSDSSLINVIDTAYIDFTSDTTQGCNPLTINFNDTISETGGTCLWDFGDGSTSGLCNTAISHNYSSSSPFILDKNYNVTLKYTNAIGCISTITKSGLITLHSQPNAAFIASPQPTTMLAPEIEFSDYSTGLVNSWDWSFAGLGTSVLQNPTYVFPDTGTYGVTLVVRNQFTCTDTTYGKVVIDPVLLFYYPNSFTPDGDGNNDNFTVKGYDINPNIFEMNIFDRWGSLICKSTSLLEGWNGKMNNTGKMCQEAIYVWKVNFKDSKGAERVYWGHVFLQIKQ